MHSPLEIARSYIEIGIHKTKLPAFKMVLLGIFAGLFIGFAGIASTVGGATVENPSLSRLLSACLFPAGMAMVLVSGSELFTGNNLIVIAFLDKKIKLRAMLKNWFFVYIGNFIGAGLVALLVVYGHTPDLFSGDLANSIVKAATHRTNLTFLDSFIRGILCNMLVCIAVWAAFASKQVAGKLLMSFWPVMLFVLCGFEHSIADIYFCLAGIFASREYGITANGLNMGTFLLKSLLPVTLGNLAGGLSIGIGYWVVYLRHTPWYKFSIESEQEEMDIAEEY